jgi:hypothetical protein
MSTIETCNVDLTKAKSDLTKFKDDSLRMNDRLGKAMSTINSSKDMATKLVSNLSITIAGGSRKNRR